MGVVEKESGVQLVYKTGGVNFTKTEMAHELNTYTAAMDASNIRYLPICSCYAYILVEVSFYISTTW